MIQIEYQGYYIKTHPQFVKSYVVVTTGRGGKIPDVLSGMFTSTGVAKQAVDRYLESKPNKKEVVDAQTVNSG